jgi:hypothetical protein
MSTSSLRPETLTWKVSRVYELLLVRQARREGGSQGDDVPQLRNGQPELMGSTQVLCGLNARPGIRQGANILVFMQCCKPRFAGALSTRWSVIAASTVYDRPSFPQTASDKHLFGCLSKASVSAKRQSHNLERRAVDLPEKRPLVAVLTRRLSLGKIIFLVTPVSKEKTIDPANRPSRRRADIVERC